MASRATDMFDKALETLGCDVRPQPFGSRFTKSEWEKVAARSAYATAVHRNARMRAIGMERSSRAVPNL